MRVAQKEKHDPLGVKNASNGEKVLSDEFNHPDGVPYSGGECFYAEKNLKGKATAHWAFKYQHTLIIIFKILILNVISRYHELLNGILNVIDLERRKVIQKHSYLSSADSIRSPHEIDNEKN